MQGGFFRVGISVVILSIVVLFYPLVSCQAQIIITCAGTGTLGTSGDGGPATLAMVETPSGIAADKAGNIFFADQNANRIRKITAGGTISTIAGMGGIGAYSGDGGPATDAHLNFPQGVGVDKRGNLYIADQFNNVIRKVDTSGIITTCAGNGGIGFSGNGVPATDATLWHPADVGVDSSGNIFFVDQDNSVVRKVNSIGIITTVAGNDTAGYRGDNGPATAAKLNFPEGIAVDPAGNVFVADLYNHRVRKINGSGTITTVAGNGVSGFGGDGFAATAANLFQPSAVALDSLGNIYIADANNDRIRKVSPSGIITTIAGNGMYGTSGDGGLATAAELSTPKGVAVNSSGNVFIADFNNSKVREIKYGVTALSRNDITPGAMPIIIPNPSITGQFELYLENMSGAYTVEIRDIFGKCAFTDFFYLPNAKIDMRDQPPGFYVLSVGLESGFCMSMKIQKM